VNTHYIPVHTQPFYRDLGFKDGDFPEAERHYGAAMSLPLYPALTDGQQEIVAQTLEGALL
jgi:dTDP-4-amino-4,6-dideoxygalactose transaminase